MIGKMKGNRKTIIGVDEAGRGSFAGRVFVGAVLLSPAHRKLVSASSMKLADSKKLTPSQREAWMEWMKKQNIPYAWGASSSVYIDRKGIVPACTAAAQGAIKKVLEQSSSLRPFLVLDAGLHAGEYESRFSHTSFPRADEIEPAVSLASIVAKVMRDREMVRLAKKYPGYGFEVHKGYGTALHRNMIGKRGLCPIHRLTFTAKYRKVDEEIH